MKNFILLFVFLSGIVGASTTVEDAIVLANSGVSETVIVSWAEQQQCSLSADDVIRMHLAKVPVQVVVTLSKRRSADYVIVRSVTPARSIIIEPTYYYSRFNYYPYAYYPYHGSGMRFNFSFGHHGGVHRR